MLFGIVQGHGRSFAVEETGHRNVAHDIHGGAATIEEPVYGQQDGYEVHVIVESERLQYESHRGQPGLRDTRGRDSGHGGHDHYQNNLRNS